MPNSLDNSRLGFMVSKKIAKRANQRNYMKRFIREFFRHHQQGWVGIDLIIRVQRKFTKDEWSLVTGELETLTSQFTKSC